MNEYRDVLTEVSVKYGALSFSSSSEIVIVPVLAKPKGWPPMSRTSIINLYVSQLWKKGKRNIDEYFFQKKKKASINKNVEQEIGQSGQWKADVSNTTFQNVKLFFLC